MQKKSLLVALFCGALCLTGCLKNEESASVAQVRIAKANELNSIADLNKAKAQAEVIYANAEATLKQAEAELKQAEAALKNAEAETEKVNAELLKVKVEIEKVKVEEEKVKLQMMQADLESRLAALEVEKAAAEAAIQGWVNVLEDLVAKAEINAVKNSQDLIEAEYDLEAYILKQEGMKADSARIYAALYFEALDSVAVLQAKELAVKAAKVLVNRGALDVREFIYDQIEENNKQIDENNAKIEALKKYQTMDTTAAKAALLEARIAMTEAFNEYKDYVDAQEAAEDAYEALNEKKSLFVSGTDPSDGGWPEAFVNFIKENGNVKKTEKQDFKDFEAIEYSGYYVDDKTAENGKKFIPLWKKEQVKDRWTLYPSAEEQSVRTSFFQTKEIKIAPAEIFYENIEGYLDTIVNRKTRQIAKDVESAKTTSANKVKDWQDKIKTNEDSLALMKKYVEARKDTIAKYENEIAALVAQYNGDLENLKDARTAYEEYMVVAYDIKKKYFEDVFMAEADTMAYHDSVTATQLAYDLVEDLVPVYEEARTTAVENETTAHTAYLTEKAIYEQGDTDDLLKKAEANWNPKFKSSVWKWESSARETAKDYYVDSLNNNIYVGGFKWISINSSTTSTAVWTNNNVSANVGSSQLRYLKAKDVEKVALVEWQAKQLALANTPKTPADAYAAAVQAEADAHAAYLEAGTAVRIAEIYEELGESLYTSAKTLDDTAKQRLVDAAKAWNPAFDNAAGDPKYDEDKDEWYKGDDDLKVVAGTAQAARLTADALYDEAYAQVNNNSYKGEPTLKAKLAGYKTKLETANGKYEQAFNALLTALGVDEDEYEEDPEVRKLYNAMVEAFEFKNEWETKLTRLAQLYGARGYSNDGGHNWQTFIAPVEAPTSPYTTGDHFNQRLGISWILSNYHIDPSYEYVKEVKLNTKTGKYEVVKEEAAIILGYTKTDATTGKTVGNPEESISFQNIDLNKNIADEPKNLQTTIKDIQDEIKPINEGVAAVKAALKELQGYEAEYKNWVAEREEAYEAVNEAKKDVFDSYNEYLEAKADFQAAEAVVNEGVWVYDPEFNYPGKTPWNSNGYERTGNGEHFVKIPIAKEIQKLEKENEQLEKQNAKYRQDLSDGKVCLQYVNEILDEILDQIEEAIQIWAAIAEQYKAIMNGYLGIVEESDGETGPLDGEGEGDDEE